MASASLVSSTAGPRWPALRHSGFRIFYVGQVISLIGTWTQSVAQGWLVLELSNSPFQVGLVSALSMLPVLFMSLPAGVYADRGDRRRIVLVTQLLSLLQAAVLAFLVWHKQVG